MERPGTTCWDGARTPGGAVVRTGAGGWGLYALMLNTAQSIRTKYESNNWGDNRWPISR